MTVPTSRRGGQSENRGRVSSCAITADSGLPTSISRTSRAEIRRQIGAGRGEKLPEGTTDCGKYCEVLPGKSEIVLPITSFLRIWHNHYQKRHLADASRSSHGAQPCLNGVIANC